MLRSLLPALLLALFFPALRATGDDKPPVHSQAETHVFKAAHVDPNPQLIQTLKVPPDFRISVFASGMGQARMLFAAKDGSLYVTRREGDVKLLRDRDGDGHAESAVTAAKLKNVHGITFHDGKAYLAAIRELYRADVKDDGTFENLTALVNDLPDAGQHPNRTLAFGPDGRLYLSVGSTCNACDEANLENATLLSMKADGSDRKVFAKGLRNTIGFAWHPQTQELWGADNGIDGLGDDEQKEELNHIVEGADYGWPYVYADQKLNPERQPKDVSPQEYAKHTTPPVLLYQAHSAPIALTFYSGKMFPSDYAGDAFIAMHGSWNRKTATGYKVVRVHFENGKPIRFDDFLTGFLTDNGSTEFGRVTGLAVGPDGSLFVSDDSGGNIYRVTYQPKSVSK